MQWFGIFYHVIGGAGILSIHYGDIMAKKTRPRFNPEFKVELSQLVLD